MTINVDVVEYLGTESQIVGHLQVSDGQRVSAIVPGDAKHLLHQTVSLTANPEFMHVFDAGSGLSLRPLSTH